MDVKSRTGMQGVYLVAAELTFRGFIVSVTSRSARGADLLVTDQDCQTSFAVQVKTNRKAASFWLLSEYAGRMTSKTFIYVFVNLKGNERPEFHVVPSEIVAAHVCEDKRPGGTFYSFDRSDAQLSDTTQTSEGWEVFGNPEAQLALEAVTADERGA